MILPRSALQHDPQKSTIFALEPYTFLWGRWIGVIGTKD